MKNLNLSSIKDLFAKLTKNLSWLFLVLLILILVMEIFEVKQSVQLILSSNDVPVVVKRVEGVRINFQNYDKAISRIQQGQGYEPNSAVLSSPFGIRQ